MKPIELKACCGNCQFGEYKNELYVNCKWLTPAYKLPEGFADCLQVKYDPCMGIDRGKYCPAWNRRAVKGGE